MIDIDNLKRYFEEGNVIITQHAAERLRERDIRMSYIKEALFYGEIIEQYEDDVPFPSCLILGYVKEKAIHVVMSDEGSSSRIITSYWPDMINWHEDHKTRRDAK